jgi:hypothetical protein
MKHMKTVDVPATTRQVLDHTTCDFCGQKLPSGEHFEYDEVTILRNKGERYPEYWTSEKTAFDCCAGCWESKVLPALRSLGAEPTVTEDDG